MKQTKNSDYADK
ncbi:23S rRNA methyltransferase attenuation leader peptide [Enterococcus faecalis]|nr:23S rRNA methyltransferase attenuation leader peptide [Streptococcus suis]MCE3370483.1 23S rRNA methyltransferase attenuation leader peptide [Staphylococcus aureus]MCH1677724.1 23S rRNA methyltransferase attenuation leader peptide [Enterococcus faecalis]MCH3638237.1 23S rRNA methyltransferase attenuation leader peptide [Enterococcus faecium]MDV8607230.1 23S rRNA methyltransferase attenuation leader peptide [Streptococcus pneumoniae]